MRNECTFGNMISQYLNLLVKIKFFVTILIPVIYFQYGFTPLHLAAQSGHDSLVRMLLNQGVQVDATSTTMVSIIIPLFVL